MTFILSNAQISAGEVQASATEIHTLLSEWATEIHNSDPELAMRITAYREEKAYQMLQRIADMTRNAQYQKAIFLLSLSKRFDFTTDPAFAYLRGNSLMTGNTKTRHILMMAKAFGGHQ